MVALSRAGVPSAFNSLLESVVRKPAVAGPKPTHTISTSIRCRSIAGASVVAILSGAIAGAGVPGSGAAAKPGNPRASRDHHGGERSAARSLARREPVRQQSNLARNLAKDSRPLAPAQGPALSTWVPSASVTSRAPAGGAIDAGNNAFQRFEFFGAVTGFAGRSVPGRVAAGIRRPVRRRCGRLPRRLGPPGHATSRVKKAERAGQFHPRPTDRQPALLPVRPDPGSCRREPAASKARPPAGRSRPGGSY